MFYDETSFLEYLYLFIQKVLGPLLPFKRTHLSSLSFLVVPTTNLTQGGRVFATTVTNILFRILFRNLHRIGVSWEPFTPGLD